MTQKIFFYIGLFILGLTTNLQAQTADVSRGCVPLTVNFSADAMDNYFWDFGDSENSSDQNPSHIFVNPGTFNVQLFDQQNGTKVGDIEITVYADPIIEITSNVQGGCSPLVVDFTPSITIDDGINISSYLWSFGDGQASNNANPSHTYTNSGTYTVSLKIETSIPECDKTEIFQDYITVDGAKASFSFTPSSSCTAPATFQFSNTTPNAAGNTYQWSFGNGNSSTQRDPGSITYDAEGSYIVTLTVKSVTGCESVFSQVVSVGPPEFILDVPDTVCINVRDFFINNSGTSNSQWNFGPNGTPSNSTLSDPNVLFNSPGLQTITLTIFDDEACQSDTTFMVFVENPIGDFTMDPATSCSPEQLITFTATNPDYAVYNWSFTSTNSSSETFNFVCPDVDSFAQNMPELEKYSLFVQSQFGCVSPLVEKTFTINKPNARFIPSPARGCAPLNVAFEDLSEGGTTNIVSWTWINGDGTQETSNSGLGYSHVYTQPGEYNVLLIIENSDGCIDTSYSDIIYVGESLASTVTIDNQTICIGDTVSIAFDNLDPRIDAWHFDSDASRFNHCWTGPNASHGFFTEPGVFDINISVDYNGCISSELLTDKITVNGAAANLAYMINCESPFDVMLKNESIGEDQWNWTVGDSIIPMMADSFVFTFEETGDYTVYLEASDLASGCAATIDSQVVHIRNVQSNFELDTILCDNVEYTLDASMSVDVDKDCHKGYLWILPSNRPRELDDDSIMQFFPTPGYNEVILITEDMNGCVDSLTKSGFVYSMDPDFSFDEGPHCLPVELQFTDLTVGDTTITEWEWTYGEISSEDQNPSLTFGPASVLPIVITLSTTDAAGCTDVITKEVEIYEPVSNIILDPGSRICIGETINFLATDFTAQGSFLNFTWDFGEEFGMSNDQSTSVLFDQSGIFPVLLTYTEVASGCIGSTPVTIEVGAIPEASFTTNVDGMAAICYPEIIEFTNTSTVDGQADYIWNLGNGVITNDENPTISYGKGTFDVNLIVTTEFGCTNDVTTSITLVGPEGTITADNPNICNGQEITFTLANQVDVNSFTWDFRDGTTVDDVNPVTHTYAGQPTGLKFVRIILKSTDTGCELIDSIPILINDVFTFFTTIDTTQFCPGRFGFNNESADIATQFLWDFGNGTTSMEENPVVVYTDTSPKTVTLTATDPLTGCTGTFSDNLEISVTPEIHKFVDAFSPNGDDINNFFSVAVKEGFEDAVSVVQLKVYNRWGELVYDNENPSEGWDGKYNGEDAPIGVYAYFIEIEIQDCGTFSQQGNVTLLR